MSKNKEVYLELDANFIVKADPLVVQVNVRGSEVLLADQRPVGLLADFADLKIRICVIFVF